MAKATRKITRTWKYGKVFVTAVRYYMRGGYEKSDWYAWEVLVSANVRGNHQTLEHHTYMDRDTAERVLATWRRNTAVLLEEVVPTRGRVKPYRRNRDWMDPTLGDPDEDRERYGLRH